MGNSTSILAIDFTNVKTENAPEEDCVEILSKIDKCAVESQNIIELINNWETLEIYKKAAADGTVENMSDAFEEINGSIESFRTIQSFSKRVTHEFLELFLYYLNSEHKKRADKTSSIEKSTSENWAVLAKIAEALSMVLKLDASKSCKTDIQNEISMIKRFCSIRENMINNENNTESNKEETVEKADKTDETNEEEKEEEENKEIESKMDKDELKMHRKRLEDWRFPEGMSIDDLIEMGNFFSHPTPFMVDCVRSIGPHINKEENVFMDELIRFVPNFYLQALKAEVTGGSSEETLQDAMITSAVMADRILPEGIFHPNSEVDVIGMHKLLSAAATERSEMLIKQLKFWSMHFHDETTPPKIKKKF